METILEDITEKVRIGSKCVADFKNKQLRINRKLVDLSAKPSGIGQFADLDEWLDKAEDLYDSFKYSRPTKTSMARERRCKFKGLTVPMLIRQFGYEGFAAMEPREVAQARLESFIVISLVEGAFKPEELFAKDWFYQGQDKNFILRKDWF